MKKKKETYGMFTDIKPGCEKSFTLSKYNASSVRTRASELNKYVGFKKFTVTVKTKQNVMIIKNNYNERTL